MLDCEKVEAAAKVAKDTVREFEENEEIPWFWVEVTKDVMAAALGIEQES